MAQTSHDRAIGRLEGKMDAMLSGFDTFQQSSSTSRKQVYGQLEDIKTKVTAVDVRVAGVEEDVEKLKPIAEHAKKLHNRALGALAVVGGGASAIAALFWGKFSKVFTGL